MIDTPQTTQTTAHDTAVIRCTIPRGQIQDVMGPGRSELMDTIAAQGVAPAGPWFSHHLRMGPDIFDFETGVPVATPIAAAGRVKPGELPATRVARTVYHGEFEAWIVAEGLTPRPDLWECYVTGPESDPDPATWRTELNRPLAS
jgi:effector-binding domain-containing protein